MQSSFLTMETTVNKNLPPFSGCAEVFWSYQNEVWTSPLLRCSDMICLWSSCDVIESFRRATHWTWRRGCFANKSGDCIEHKFFAFWLGVVCVYHPWQSNWKKKKKSCVMNFSMDHEHALIYSLLQGEAAFRLSEMRKHDQCLQHRFWTPTPLSVCAERVSDGGGWWG